MEQPSWTEGRLDDLNKKVDVGIGRLDDERKEFRGEMREGFEKVDERFEKVDERFDKVDERFEKVYERFDKVYERFDKVDDEFKSVRSEIKEGFDRMYRLLIAAAVSLGGVLFTALVAALVAATQL